MVCHFICIVIYKYNHVCYSHMLITSCLNMLCLGNLSEIVGSHSAYFVVPGVTSCCHYVNRWYIGGPGWLLWILLHFISMNNLGRSINTYYCLPCTWKLLLTHCGLATSYDNICELTVIIAPGSGLPPNGTRPMPGTMLTNQNKVIWHALWEISQGCSRCLDMNLKLTALMW